MSGRRYSDEFRERVLGRYQEVGLRAAERETGVDRSTIIEWARAAGLDAVAISARVSEQHARAAAASAQRTFRERQEARERMVNRLIKTSEAAQIRELEVLAAGGFSQEDLQALTNARMKAIQQFELLEGRATSRQDYGGEQLLEGVALAFRTVLELLAARVGHALADEVRDLFADRLREVRGEMMQIEAEAVEEAEVAGEIEPPGEEAA